MQRGRRSYHQEDGLTLQNLVHLQHPRSLPCPRLQANLSSSTGSRNQPQLQSSPRDEQVGAPCKLQDEHQPRKVPVPPSQPHHTILRQVRHRLLRFSIRADNRRKQPHLIIRVQRSERRWYRREVECNFQGRRDNLKVSTALQLPRQKAALYKAVQAAQGRRQHQIPFMS